MENITCSDGRWRQLAAKSDNFPETLGWRTGRSRRLSTFI